MKYVRSLSLALGLLFMLCAVAIMAEQTLDKTQASSEPVYVRDVPKYIVITH